ncbi:phage major capsid protein [Aldersonia kunmingensis]|uniref:phage major capsid protein n=1 Tax=Aldersonia kunmingensis TaxID=408066 RepID=UPI000832A8D4|nr:phage major capsid protein [Aldersonia kunmingensis]
MTIQTTIGTPGAFHPDVVSLPPADAIPDSLLVAATYRAGIVQGDEHYVRVPYVRHDDPPGWIAESAEIPESDPATSEIVVSTGKVALIDALSREQASQPIGLEVFRQAAAKEVAQRADRLLIWSPAPTTGSWPPAGLLAQPHAEGGTIGTNLDELADAVATVENTGGTANVVITSPAAWATLSKIKASTDSAASLLGAGTSAAERTLLGIKVIVSAALIPDDPDDPHAVIVADTNGVLAAYGDLEYSISEHLFFGRDSLAVRTSIRCGAALAEPDRLVELSIEV